MVRRDLVKGTSVQHNATETSVCTKPTVHRYVGAGLNWDQTTGGGVMAGLTLQADRAFESFESR
jgi:hypothetical protein